MEQTSSPEYHLRIREIPSSERPRERLRDHGPAALANAELLAIILRSGTAKESVLTLAQRLLTRHGGLGGLARMSYEELLHEPGLGEAKASEVKALFQLAARIQALEVGERPVIRSPQDVNAMLGGEMATFEQEHLRVLLINTRNQVIGSVYEVYVGNVSSALVRPAEVFRDAVRQNAPSLIVVHNHPSGDPSPSPDDIHLTKLLVAAGDLLNIEVLDHVVIGANRYASLKSLGLWPTAGKSTAKQG